MGMHKKIGVIEPIKGQGWMVFSGYCVCGRKHYLAPDDAREFAKIFYHEHRGGEGLKKVLRWVKTKGGD